MKRIRINNDIALRWTILTNKEAVSLEGRDLRVELKSAYNKKQVDFTIEDNVIIFYFLGAEQRNLGVYSVILQETTGGIMRTMDECKAFELVPHSCMEGGEDEGNLKTEVVELTSNMAAYIGGPSGGAKMEEIQAALDSLQLAVQGNDTEVTLTAIKNIVSAIPTLTYTDAIAAIKSVVDTLPKSTLTAQDKADIIAAIQAVTPTIDFTDVLNAIASSETAIKQAMPTDYAGKGEYDAILARIEGKVSLTAQDAIDDWNA